MEKQNPTKQPTQAKDMPAAGPHAKPELTDDSKTPGAGTLPEPGSQERATSG
ncbi:hypothetical protein [Undibacter mobilis]|uniref:hypothetical protein n=1 Tax=Undibacter mobilis TaxID=2292256 RepID=UPI00143DE116|nr:hypothetical protein [Undibacter mobilis]